MIAYIIIWLNIFIWLVPPFRQFRTKYFLFFLILALADPLQLFFLFVVHISIDMLRPVIAFIAFISLIKRDKKILIISLGVVLIYLLIMNSLTTLELLIVGIIIQTLILLTVIYDFLMFTSEFKAINLFLVILIMYQVMVVYKFIASILDVHNGVVIFYLSTFLQIIFCVLFTIFNVNSKKFLLVKEDELLEG